MSKYGFYSETQAEHVGYAFYKTLDGQTVRVSFISEQRNPDTSYPDLMFVAEVADMLQSFWYGASSKAAEPKTDPSIPVPATKLCSFAYYGVPPCTCGHCRPTRTSYGPNPFGY